MQTENATLQTLPAPTAKCETWRFAKPERFLPANSESPAAITPGTAATIAAEGLPAGACVLPLTEALAQTEAPYAQTLQACMQPTSRNLGSQFFEAAMLEHVSANATFIYIPKGATVEAPITLHHNFEATEGALAPQTIIIAEANTQANIFETFTGSAAFIYARAAVHAGEGAHINCGLLNTLSAQTNLIYTQQTTAGANANVHTTAFNLGAQHVRMEQHIHAAGPQCRIEAKGLCAPTGKETVDVRTFQHHTAPHAVSDVLFKNALMGKSRTIFSGMIRVEEEAAHTDAYQTNRNLLLSEDARCDTLPGLEILTDEVKCSHGATSSSINAAEAFYLQSRGIPTNEANRLLSLGFLEEVVANLPTEALQTLAREAVHAKFEG